MSTGTISKDLATIFDEDTKEDYLIVSGKRFAKAGTEANYELHAGMAILRQ